VICADRHDEDVVPTRHTSVQSRSHLDSGLWILGSGEVGFGFGAVVASCSSPANRVSKCPSARWCIFAGLTASAVLISFYLFTHSAPVELH